MKRACWCALALIGLLAFGGCKGKRKPVDPTARAEAAQNASEADFAGQIRDYARAETLLVKAVELDPNNHIYWKALGVTHKKRGDNEGARKAYIRARDEAAADYEESKHQNLLAIMNIVELDVLLGDQDRARRFLEEAAHEHPDNSELQRFVKEKVIDKMLADPSVKALSV